MHINILSVEIQPSCILYTILNWSCGIPFTFLNRLMLKISFDLNCLQWNECIRRYDSRHNRNLSFPLENNLPGHKICKQCIGTSLELDGLRWNSLFLQRVLHSCNSIPIILTLLNMHSKISTLHRFLSSTLYYLNSFSHCLCTAHSASETH